MLPIKDFSKNILIYIDDLLFSGGTLLCSLQNRKSMLETKKILFIFLETHSGGEHYVTNQLKLNGIKFNLWRLICLNNYNAFPNNSDVYWPIAWTAEEIKNEPLLDQYIKDSIEPRFKPQWRYPEICIGTNKIFTCPENRIKIEREFLIAGLKLREKTNTFMQPLGFSKFAGFGATVITYRNVPNNAPLCIWWGNPGNQGGLGNWYPLMRRR